MSVCVPKAGQGHVVGGVNRAGRHKTGRHVAHGQDATLVTTALVGLSLIALLVELQGQAISAKTVALLGVMVAITSVLRFVEVAVPMPGGFSPIFAPIIR